MEKVGMKQLEKKVVSPKLATKEWLWAVRIMVKSHARFSFLFSGFTGLDCGITCFLLIM
jgi:hypothetical protein